MAGGEDAAGGALGDGARRARPPIRSDPRAGHQRHRGPSPHEPRTGPAAGGGARRDPRSRGRLLDRRVRPGSRSPRPAAGSRAPARKGRLRLRRRDRRQQQRRRGLARAGGFRARPRGRRLARRARRDRRLVQDPRDPRGLGRPAAGSRERRTARRPRTTAGRSQPRSPCCSRSTRRTTRSAATRSARRLRSSPASRARPECRGSTIRGPVASSALEEFGVAGEPTVAECLAAGADLVTFSGDKLFSGPQAGFLVGREDLVKRAAAHPVARAVRPDKLTLAALAATLGAWKTGAWRAFPGLPRGGGDAAPSSRSAAKRILRATRFERSHRRGRSLTRGVRRRHEPGEALRVPRPLAPTLGSLGRSAGGEPAGGEASDRRPRRERRGAARPAFDRAGGGRRGRNLARLAHEGFGSGSASRSVRRRSGCDNPFMTSTPKARQAAWFLPRRSASRPLRAARRRAARRPRAPEGPS